jgi:DNA-binding transcriptional MocR family regulator
MTNWRPDLPAEGVRYLAIADALAEDIAQGRLVPGTRLPTHRDLAWHLGVTVGTVTRAYREAERRGLLIGEVGRGTFVREGAGIADYRIGGDLSLSAGAHCPLHYAAPPLVPAMAALAPTLHAIAETPGLTAFLDYPPNEGHEGHRQAGASWLARHQLAVSPAQVVLTNGAHHAVFTALMALTRPGDRILVEPLTYPGLQPLARLLDLRLEAVACDDEGILPEALAATAGAQEARALYCIPTLQNPTTATLGRERRQAIARIAEELDLAVIEDDIFRLLAETPPPPPISHFAPEQGIFITSLSKTTAPGLRVGFIAAAPRRVEALRQAALATSGKASPFSLEIARRWIQQGTAETILGELKQELAARRAIALSLLQDYEPRCTPGAMHLMLDLPEPWQAAEFAAAALDGGVKISTSQPFAVQPRYQKNAVRLCLGPPRSQDELRAGLERLRAVLERSPRSYYETVV